MHRFRGYCLGASKILRGANRAPGIYDCGVSLMPLLIAFQMLDTLTTWIGVVQLGGREMHPYIAWLISMDRWDMVILGKLACCGLFYLALKWFRVPKKWERNSIRLATAISSFAVLWNTIGILTVIL